MPESSEERIEDLLLLQRVAQRISSILELDRLLEEILADVAGTFGYHRCAVFLKDDATNELVIHGWTGPYYREGDRFRIGVDGIVGHVGETGETYYARDVLVDPYYRFTEEQTRSELEIPLMAGGRLIGVFDVQHTELDGFPPARVQLLEALAGHVATAIENARLFRKERLEKERMSKELAEARQIQIGLFLAPPPAVPGFAIDARCIPCREVGGDWFDYLPLEGGRVGVVLADVSGKGMAAALLMSSTRSLLRLLAEDASSPAEVLRRLNRLLLKDFPAARFVTMVYAVLDAAKRRLLFANAGHPPPLFADSAGARFLETETGWPLGIQDGPFAEREIRMRTPSRLVLYSDGLSEAMNPAQEEYGAARIRDHLSAASPTVESLLDDVHRFTSGAAASDDLTVVMIQSL
jgi:sigma-B regulation protein RsbU (phosphoserine phosphatase)